MKWKIYRFLLLIVIGVSLAGCNKRDLNRLEDIAEDHAARLRRLEKMIIEAEQQIDLINKLLVEYDGRLTISGMNNLDNGDYRIFFSDGDTVTVNGGQTPVIGLSDNNTWVINGTDTGVKCVGENVTGEGIAPQVRQQEGKWQLSVDGGKTWQDTGVKVKGEDGVIGQAPRISVGANGNWHIDGVDTGFPLHGADGQAAGAPQVKVLENGNWGVKSGAGDWKDTGVPARGLGGADGEDGVGVPYITEVTVAGTQVTFKFSANIPGVSPATNIITVTRKVDFSYTILEDGKWVTLPSKPLAIPIGGYREIEFKITLPAGETWHGRSIVLPDGFDFLGEEREGNSGTLKEKIKIAVNLSVGEYRSGLVFLNIHGSSGKDYTTLIPVATLMYRLDVTDFDFTDSYVYHVFNNAGERVAEVCREYVRDGSAEGKVATVVYPYDENTLKYGTGFVTGLGGTVDPVTGQYEPLAVYPAGRNYIYFLSSSSFMTDIEDFMQSTPLGSGDVAAETMTDVSGNRYKVVKVGSQYWMAENLRTEMYRDGEVIPLLPSVADWNTHSGGYCYYNNDKVANKEKYGVLYNGNAVAGGKLAPAGWHIPDSEEWLLLEMFLGITGENIPADGWRGSIEGNKLKNAAAWGEAGTEFNLTNFGGMPAGSRGADGAFVGLGAFGVWWAANGDGDRLVSRGLSAGNGGIRTVQADKKEGYSVRCVKDVFIEK